MKLNVFLALAILLCLCTEVSAKNIYVDRGLSGNITNGTYSVRSRNGSGNDGDAYTTIRAAINAMSGGDDIYLRGGTYREGNIPIPASKNGTSGNWSSIQSYQGEWAIIDGQRRAESSVVLGSANYNKDGNGDVAYWKFERLEITGGGGSGGSAAAIWVNGGPIAVRYCYLHDNLGTTYTNNPGAITSMVMHDSVIEYNYFKNNGSNGSVSHNCAHINIHSDYQEQLSDVANINHAIRKNEIRYNLFDGSYVGYKHKNEQILGNRSGSDFEYKNFGDKIHHNIFLNCHQGIWVNQDFAQVYNNIIDSGDLIVHYDLGGLRSPVTLHTTVYNNTLINGRIFYSGDEAESKHPYWACYNNIIDGSAGDYGNRCAPISVYQNLRSGGLNLTDNKINRNYFYRTNNDQILLGDRAQSVDEGFMMATQFDSYFRTMNYSSGFNSSNQLYAGSTGANKYKTRGAHSIGSGATIATGGLGGSHPYLSNVAIPRYIGATNPDNSRWVDTVTRLTNTNVLQNGGLSEDTSTGTDTSTNTDTNADTGTDTAGDDNSNSTSTDTELTPPAPANLRIVTPN